MQNLNTSEFTNKEEARSTKKYRVQFDFTKEALAELDMLKAMLSQPTRAATIRMALSMLYFIAKEVLKGNKLLIESNGTAREVVLPIGFTQPTGAKTWDN